MIHILTFISYPKIYQRIYLRPLIPYCFVLFGGGNTKKGIKNNLTSPVYSVKVTCQQLFESMGGGDQIYYVIVCYLQ